jgi:hypothetical protein
MYLARSESTLDYYVANPSLAVEEDPWGLRLDIIVCESSSLRDCSWSITEKPAKVCELLDLALELGGHRWESGGICEAIEVAERKVKCEVGFRPTGRSRQRPPINMRWLSQPRNLLEFQGPLNLIPISFHIQHTPPHTHEFSDL